MAKPNLRVFLNPGDSNKNKKIKISPEWSPQAEAQASIALTAHHSLHPLLNCERKPLRSREQFWWAIHSQPAELLGASVPCLDMLGSHRHEAALSVSMP